ncbi:mannan-binding lectin serine protease 1-like [Neolamprologus brichardi]|nr:mannan-binding lectin serine protease 1-like [Neolamprologus brichardi]
MHGSLCSPNFPEPYPRDTQLRWNVSVPDGFQIKLYFSHFDLEPSYLCEYDYVKVEAEGEVLALFCGREQTDTEAVPAQRALTSPRNSLSLLFCSDFSDEERFSGFVAHYSAVDVDECSERSDEDALCDHFCHNYIGGYYCSCRYGYRLHSDNHTCRGERRHRLGRRDPQLIARVHHEYSSVLRGALLSRDMIHGWGRNVWVLTCPDSAVDRDLAVTDSGA